MRRGRVPVVAFRLLRAAILGVLLFGSPAVRAGAFLQKPGEGIVIVGGAFTDAVRAYDSAGRLVPVAHWRKFELTTYAEYGLSEAITVIASPSLFVFRQNPPGQSRSATGIAEAGVRARLVEWDGNILSGQVVVRAPLAGQSARPFADTTRFMQTDVRLAWGRGFELAGFAVFSDLQIGFRSNGVFGHEGRMDATLGAWVMPDWLLLLQSFTTVTPGGLVRARYLQQKVAASAVYWVTSTMGVQVGGFLGLPGINSAAERGAFTAVWLRF